jgi:hypothetical protein
VLRVQQQQQQQQQQQHATTTTTFFGQRIIESNHQSYKEAINGPNTMFSRSLILLPLILLLHLSNLDAVVADVDDYTAMMAEALVEMGRTETSKSENVSMFLLFSSPS